MKAFKVANHTDYLALYLLLKWNASAYSRLEGSQSVVNLLPGWLSSLSARVISMTSYKRGISVSLKEKFKNMSWSSTGRGCRTTFPQISLRVCGSVRSTEMIWGETGGRVAHASTRLHSGRKKQLKTKNAVNPDMSMEIKIIYRKHVPTGSRKSDLLQIYSA